MPTPTSSRLYSDYLWLGLIVAFVLLTRVLGAEHSPLQVDAASFYCAGYDINFAEFRPHLPGYFLHIQLIRLFRLVMSPFQANVAPSILWSVLGAIMLFFLLRRWLDLRKTVLFCLVVVSIPTLWYHGCVSEVYAFDFFFSVALVHWGLSRKMIVFIPSVVALGAGVRQSSAIFLLPLYCWLWYNEIQQNSGSVRRMLIAHVPALFLLAAWLLPFLSICGGIAAYIKMYDLYPPGAVTPVLVNVLAIMQLSFYYASGLLALWLLSYIAQRIRRNGVMTDPQLSFAQESPSRLMLALWIGIPMLAFLFTTFTKGYVLLCIVGMALLLIPQIRRSPQWVLIVVFILNSCVYLLPSFREANIKIWLTPRWGVSKTYKALERTTTVAAQTQSRICALNSSMQELDSCMNGVSAGTWIFVDPSCCLNARAMQTRHPEMHFVVFQPADKNTGLVMYGISQWPNYSMNTLFDSLRILTSKQVYELRPDLLVDRATEHLIWAHQPSEPNKREELFRWFCDAFVKE